MGLTEGYQSISAQSKRATSLAKALIWAMVAVVIACLFFCYRAYSDMKGQRIVVDVSGQFLPYEVEDASNLLKNHIELHCEFAAHYLNSFDRMTIKKNQAKAYFLCDRKGADRVFKTYLANKNYNEALVLGHQYKNTLLGVRIDGAEEPYGVAISSRTDVFTGTTLLKSINIQTLGKISRVSAGKENRLGLYLYDFTQTYSITLPHDDTKEP